jgi:hypothetical protein
MAARAAAILAILLAGSAYAEPPAYSVTIDPGVRPQRTAAELAARFSERVTSVECQRGQTLEDPDGIFWIVRRTRPSGCVRSTYIDDATGEAFGYGRHNCGPAPTYIDVERLQKAP